MKTVPDNIEDHPLEISRSRIHEDKVRMFLYPLQEESDAVDAIVNYNAVSLPAYFQHLDKGLPAFPLNFDNNILCREARQAMVNALGSEFIDNHNVQIGICSVGTEIANEEEEIHPIPWTVFLHFEYQGQKFVTHVVSLGHVIMSPDTQLEYYGDLHNKQRQGLIEASTHALLCMDQDGNKIDGAVIAMPLRKPGSATHAILTGDYLQADFRHNPEAHNDQQGMYCLCDNNEEVMRTMNSAGFMEVQNALFVAWQKGREVASTKKSGKTGKLSSDEFIAHAFPSRKETVQSGVEDANSVVSRNVFEDNSLSGFVAIAELKQKLCHIRPSTRKEAVVLALDCCELLRRGLGMSIEAVGSINRDMDTIPVKARDKLLYGMAHAKWSPALQEEAHGKIKWDGKIGETEQSLFTEVEKAKLSILTGAYMSKGRAKMNLATRYNPSSGEVMLLPEPIDHPELLDSPELAKGR